MPTFIELDIDAITDESVARAILTLVEQLPGFEARRYDLNGRHSPRAWELERAVVDLLTQRTQLFVVQSDDAEVLIATGKHGEPPTVALSLPVDSEVLEKLLVGLPVRSVHQG